MFYLELANKHYALPIVQITGSRISFIGTQRLIMTPRIKLESKHWHRVIESPQKPHLFEQSMSLIYSTRFNEICFFLNTVRSKGDVDLEERDGFLGFLTHNMTPLDRIYSLYIHVCAAG